MRKQQSHLGHSTSSLLDSKYTPATSKPATSRAPSTPEIRPTPKCSTPIKIFPAAENSARGHRRRTTKDPVERDSPRLPVPIYRCAPSIARHPVKPAVKTTRSRLSLFAVVPALAPLVPSSTRFLFTRSPAVRLRRGFVRSTPLLALLSSPLQLWLRQSLSTVAERRVFEAIFVCCGQKGFAREGGFGKACFYFVLLGIERSLILVEKKLKKLVDSYGLEGLMTNTKMLHFICYEDID